MEMYAEKSTAWPYDNECILYASLFIVSQELQQVLATLTDESHVISTTRTHKMHKSRRPRG